MKRRGLRSNESEENEGRSGGQEAGKARNALLTLGDLSPELVRALLKAGVLLLQGSWPSKARVPSLNPSWGFTSRPENLF